MWWSSETKLHNPNSGLYSPTLVLFWVHPNMLFPKGGYNPLKFYISTLTIKTCKTKMVLWITQKKLRVLQEIQLNKPPNQVFFQ